MNKQELIELNRQVWIARSKHLAAKKCLLELTREYEQRLDELYLQYLAEPRENPTPRSNLYPGTRFNQTKERGTETGKGHFKSIALARLDAEMLHLKQLIEKADMEMYCIWIELQRLQDRFQIELRFAGQNSPQPSFNPDVD